MLMIALRNHLQVEDNATVLARNGGWKVGRRDVEVIEVMLDGRTTACA